MILAKFGILNLEHPVYTSFFLGRMVKGDGRGSKSGAESKEGWKICEFDESSEIFGCGIIEPRKLYPSKLRDAFRKRAHARKPGICPKHGHLYGSMEFRSGTVNVHRRAIFIIYFAFSLLKNMRYIREIFAWSFKVLFLIS